MKIHGTAKGGALATKDFGVAFGGGDEIFSKAGLKTYNKCDVSESPDENVATDAGSTVSLGTASDLACTGTTFQQAGILQYAISFDGINDEAVFGSSTSQFSFLYSTSYEFSINFFYAKLTASPNTESVFMNMRTSGVTSSGILMKFDDRATKNIFEVSCKLCNTPTINKVLSTAIPADTNFHMVTITGDNSDSGWKFYIDAGSAESISEVSSPSGTCDADLPLELANESGSNFWAGKLCEVSIWDRVLSASEISRLYNSGDGLAL